MILGNLAGKVVDDLTGRRTKKIKGKVVLMKKTVLEFNPLATGLTVGTSVLDRFGDLLGNGVSLQLVSAANSDPAHGFKGKVGKEAHLENWLTSLPSLTPGDTVFGVTFDWDDSIGVPGALIINNNHTTEFFLKTITLEDVPGEGLVHFVCNSWVYPAGRYKYERIFFRNKSYLPSTTPEPLRKYREQELQNLRGDGKGERKEWDRVYDYDVYNDLGDPDSGADKVRPILGTSELPYPRRGRTGRPPTRTDPKSESRLKLVNILKPLDPVEALDIYVPRDERFGHLKMSDFLAYGLKSLSHSIVPALKHFFDSTGNEFDNFKEVDDLYEGGFKLPTAVLDTIRKNVPFEMLKVVFRTDGEQFLKFPVPHVVK